jgi:hypothetical protein
MKDNRLSKMLAIGAVFALAISAAIAQTTTSVGTNVGPVGVEVTTSTGAFVASPSSDYFTFRAGTAAPVRYYYTPETVVVDPAGHTVTWTDVRADMPATVHYVRQGDRMIVKRVVLAKPVTVTKETTTTTTTTAP